MCKILKIRVIVLCQSYIFASCEIWVMVAHCLTFFNQVKSTIDIVNDVSILDFIENGIGVVGKLNFWNISKERTEVTCNSSILDILEYWCIIT